MVISRLQTALNPYPIVACWCDSIGLEHAGAELPVDLLKTVMHCLTSSQTSSFTSGCDVRSQLRGGGQLEDVHATYLLVGPLVRTSCTVVYFTITIVCISISFVWL